MSSDVLDVWKAEQGDKMVWGLSCSDISGHWWESSLKHGRQHYFVEFAKFYCHGIKS